MEADYDEVRLIPHPGPGPHALPTAVTALAFDPHQELLWTGNQYGRVMSFYGHELQKYTSFKAHSGEAVKQILFTDKGVLSIAPHSVHFSSRRGLTQWHLTDANFKDLQCMCFMSRGTSELLVAGMQDSMLKIDLEKGVITEMLPTEDSYVMMKTGGQYICAANSTGAVHIMDANSLKIVKVWQAHNGWINDMDVKSDFIVTCGYSPRQQFGHLLDGLANVFNLKTLQPLPPIPFQAGAAFVCIHPRMYTTCVIASVTGQLQVVDIVNANAVTLIKQAQVYDNNFLTALEMAPSGEALAFSTSLCQVHLWGSPVKIHFTEFSNETVFTDHVVPNATMDWSAETPLNKIGMPYYREVLLSAWPSHILFEVGAPPAKIEPAIISNLKRAEMGAFAPNSRKAYRNQIQQTRIADKGNGTIAAPKFLSEKAREAAKNGDMDEGRRTSDALETLKDLALDAATRKEVPAIYGNVEIKYSKFGVDDFDFKYYNKTRFSGLETHIANSYANPLLQLYRFTPMIRNIALQHTATSCIYEYCILCELGFLVDMLEKAAGQNCQATNFLKTFSSQSGAQSLNLLEEHAPNNPLTAMIQSTNRFLLDRFSMDYQAIPSQAQNRHMEQTLSTNMIATIRCAHCTQEQIRTEDVHCHELIYPNKNMGRNTPRGMPRQTFSQILKASVERQEQTRGWCSRCRRYQQISQRRQVQSVPRVFMINANIQSNDARHLWANSNWLPQEIGVIVGNGQFFCYEGQDLELHIQRKVHNVHVYELIGVVADVNSGENQKPHLVSLINVAPSSPDPEATDQWHLFNDFLVTQTSTEEALRFDPAWKLPSVLAYQLKAVSHVIDDSWKNNLDTAILYNRWSPAQSDDPEKFRLLNPNNEAPIPETHVGIDAEFVALQREEIEIKADGTRETIRPSRLGLARVSVLRGSGHDADLPFIDDYIEIREPVVDYLTQHSGISPGDLDRQTSRHALVGLKAAYKKLWLLLNLGCVFVGHGLIKDFRTINIHVPKAQVVDTVELFHIKARGRKLSLRFLAWLLLREDIQTDMHDSVEDARTALRLWRKYLEYTDAGVLEETLEWIYRKGAEVRFKVPTASGGLKADDNSVMGANTPGRATPEPAARPGSSAAMVSALVGSVEGEMTRSETATPVKKLGFGTGRLGFGSPIR